jgi:hypothetical protein
VSWESLLGVLCLLAAFGVLLAVDHRHAYKRGYRRGYRHGRSVGRAEACR